MGRASGVRRFVYSAMGVLFLALGATVEMVARVRFEWKRRRRVFSVLEIMLHGRCRGATAAKATLTTFSRSEVTR